MQLIRWIFAMAICFVAVAVVDASGVTIETIKEGDGVNFPQAGGKISVMSVLCPFCGLQKRVLPSIMLGGRTSLRASDIRQGQGQGQHPCRDKH